jgi:hypothetical protein
MLAILNPLLRNNHPIPIIKAPLLITNQKKASVSPSEDRGVPFFLSFLFFF